MAIVETRSLTKVFKQGEPGAVNNVNLAKASSWSSLGLPAPEKLRGCA